MTNNTKIIATAHILPILHLRRQKYGGRGDAENRIKEIKYDFGFDSFNLKGFHATEAALIFSIIACNPMSIFRMFVLQEKTQKRLSTLRFRAFAIGGGQNINGRLVLMIALSKNDDAGLMDSGTVQ